MLIPTIIIGVLAIALTVIAYTRGGGEHIQGLQSAVVPTLEIVPLLIFPFIIAGMLQQLIPTRAISKWVGTKSGWRGILIGTPVGSFMPGGPPCLLAHCCRTHSGGSRYRYHDSTPHPMVIAGIHSITAGNWYYRLEIFGNSSGLHLFLSPSRWIFS